MVARPSVINTANACSVYSATFDPKRSTNTIFPDDGFPGIVINLIHFEQNQIEFDLEKFTVKASAGIFLYRLVLACRDAGLGGTEFLANIPGTVGGAVLMNAGFSRYAGQRNEIGDLVRQVCAITPSGEKKIFDASELQFSYRHSNLENHVILWASFQLWRRPAETIQQEIKANFQYRNKEQDMRYPSSGSIFKNPLGGMSAGCLIDKAGLKGTKIGGAMVSERHGNYIVNVGQSKSADIKALIQFVQKAVFNATGVKLEPEVRIVEKP